MVIVGLCPVNHHLGSRNTGRDRRHYLWQIRDIDNELIGKDSFSQNVRSRDFEPIVESWCNSCQGKGGRNRI